MSDNSFKDISNKLESIFPKIGKIPDFSTHKNDFYNSNFEMSPKEHPMINTLDYKILEYLSKNENGEYLDISHLSDNDNLLKIKIKDLKELGYLKSRKHEPKVLDNGLVQASNKVPKCMITSKGKEYLLNVDNNISKIDNSVTYNLNNNKNTQINHDSDFAQNAIKRKEKDIPNKKAGRPIFKTLEFKIAFIIMILGLIGAALLNSNRVMNIVNSFIDNI